ncbi:MAG: UDP-N-acetylglucosamine diphosphorylase [Clostridiales Family XIII bacterium]|jgi:bifunctional UDP-N-acetylglucosamine pyrophosphorylase/glucosamine-1-phosphate N-acetyltransferase|nr:UDP-N-acetylglucosamine diphosphorylase [Clostridiales Family XIII bacterium]
MSDNEINEYYEHVKARRLRINFAHAKNGVEFINIENAYIDEDVTIGAGTVIGPDVVLEGKTVIGDNCHIRQNTRIKDSQIGNHTTVDQSVVLQSKIADDTKIGPFAYVRPGSDIGSHVKIGDFVEIKNSVIGDGTKVSHLTYVGDSDLGKGINLGCGVVFVNYDGVAKHRSTIEDEAFIGCNTNIISPVTVGEGAYIAAGTTITKDVGRDDFAIGRVRQENKVGFASKMRMLFTEKKEKSNKGGK